MLNTQSKNISVEPIIFPDREKLREARLKFYADKKIYIAPIIEQNIVPTIQEKQVPELKQTPDIAPIIQEKPVAIKIKRKYTKKKKI